ncbi:DUF6284 family protein [Streptomyces sp. RerS4]|uniref:DUF6284 family protein n=1 Tax=Streptomyces sp. RerS4 TaxID=2942449 RepID=UPI00201BD8B6|nr:DUF6284 family protein [Streptomyces sp. RerS4]UQX01000.1 DUF6284 family protein [Streptomyces sp. RerS4]
MFIDLVQDPVTGDWYGDGPTDADLAAIEAEPPVLISGELLFIDVQIALMEPAPAALDVRRRRRAEARLMAARRDAANRGARRARAGDAA